MQNSYRFQNRIQKKRARARQNTEEQRAASFGVGMTTATIGYLATLPLGGLPGFLAGFGFTVLDRLMERSLYTSIAEKLAKWGKADHVICIYDFRRKQARS